MTGKRTPTPITTPATAVTLTSAQVEKLRRDQRQLKAVIRMLNRFNVGQSTHSPVVRVKLLLNQREEHRNAIVKLIARKKSEPFL